MKGSVSIVGLGKLGACMAVCMAAKGIPVVGVDVNQTTVDAINRGEAPHFELGLQEWLMKANRHLIATTDIATIAETDTTFIVVPTPSESNGAFSLRYVKEVVAGIGRVLRDKKGYHVVAVTSTVLPGSCQYGIMPILERESGKGLDTIGFCYNPEFIALGTVIRDFLNPDFILVGESDQFAGAQVAKIYEQVCEQRRRGNPLDIWPVHVEHMSIPSAELAKIAINGFVTTKITYANMLADLCERIPGANVDAVTRALGMDRRIGEKYLRAGMGYGGPCFPRDNVALAAFAKFIDDYAHIPTATDQTNRSRLDQLVRAVVTVTPGGSTIAVLGLSYKLGTNVTDDSPGFLLAMKVAAHGFTVNVHDPLVTRDRAPHGLTDYCDTLADAVRDAHLIVVANPDPAFADLGDCTGKIVIDPWRIVTGHTGADYRPFGIGASDEATVARLRKMWA